MCIRDRYLVFLFTSKTAGQKRAKLALLLLPLAPVSYTHLAQRMKEICAYFGA